MLVLTFMLGISLLGTTEIPLIEEMAPLDIKLPEPCIGGTPLGYLLPHPLTENAYFSPNLEPARMPDPFLAPKSARIVSLGAEVTASTKPVRGKLKKITDGSKECGEEHVVELPAGFQWVQIDLGDTKELFAVVLWHWHKGVSVYFDVIVQGSNDPDFEDGVTILYNNDFSGDMGFGRGADKEYIEYHYGRIIDARGLQFRYLRLYSRGNVHNDRNHYIEVEVWGK